MKMLQSIIGSIGFTILLDVPIKKLIYSIIGICISAGIYESMYSENRVFVSAFTASLIVNIYGEVIVRYIKIPSTIIILPSTIPLLPGSALYYAISSLIKGNYSSFRYHIIQTAQTGLGIALGALVATVFIIMLKELKEE